MNITTNRALIASGIALGIAAIVFGASAVGVFGAATAPPLEPIDAQQIVTEPDSPPGFDAPLPPAPSELSAAADRDPFRADRRRPARPYRITVPRPEPRPEREPEPEPEPAPPPSFSVLGTVAMPDGGLAIIRTEGGDVRVASVGESIDGFLLGGIDGEVAIFLSGDDSHTLEVDEPSQNPELERERERRERERDRRRRRRN